MSSNDGSNTRSISPSAILQTEKPNLFSPSSLNPSFADALSNSLYLLSVPTDQSDTAQATEPSEPPMPPSLADRLRTASFNSTSTNADITSQPVFASLAHHPTHADTLAEDIMTFEEVVRTHRGLAPTAVELRTRLDKFEGFLTALGNSALGVNETGPPGSSVDDVSGRFISTIEGGEQYEFLEMVKDMKGLREKELDARWEETVRMLGFLKSADTILSRDGGGLGWTESERSKRDKGSEMVIGANSGTGKVGKQVSGTNDTSSHQEPNQPDPSPASAPSLVTALSHYASTNRHPSLTPTQRSTLSTLQADPEVTQHMLNWASTAAKAHDLGWASGSCLASVQKLISAEGEARDGVDDFEDILRAAAGEQVQKG
ncbi:hypothetical protein IAT38_003717 [Cryptococcus sp. DSM 104549]